MTSTPSKTAVSVSVRAVEKRYQPIRCYKFVLEVQWSDQSRYVVYRSYSEFMELHLLLTEAFPIEAGEIDSMDRVLPKLSGSSIFSRGEVQKVAQKRRGEISDYCNRLMTLQPRISQFPKLLEFFELRDDDLNIPNESKMKKSSAFKSIGKKLKRNKKKAKKNNDFGDMKFEITSPLQLETYVVALDYKAAGKGQINLRVGEHIDVIDKNVNGWWYVSCNGIEGWAPATYLDKLPSTDSSSDEVPCLAGEMFLTIKAYKAQMNDELSFGSQVVVEVLNKILDGWWIASYDQKVGYVPSTYLKAYKNPYLSASTNPAQQSEPDASPVMPTPRRQSLLPGSAAAPKVRDLQPYRRVTEKRRQRTIKHKKSNETDMSDLSMTLSCIMERDSIYLEPSRTSNTSSLSSTYVDPDPPSGPPTPAARTPSPRMTKSPAIMPRNFSADTLTIDPATQCLSKISDNYGYEPISNYKIREDLDVAVPSYRAPGVPATSSPVASPRLSIVSSDAARPRFSMDSDYEPINTKRASTLPAVITAPKLNLRVKIPPPKPDKSLLTRLSNEGGDYSYTSIVPKGGSGSNTSPQSMPVRQPHSASPTIRPPPRSPLPPRSTTAAQSKAAPPKAPRAGEHQSPDSPLSQVLTSKLNNLHHVSDHVTPIKEAERNNNVGDSSDGKIYEEWLVKPSQLKGQRNAQLRAPR